VEVVNHARLKAYLDTVGSPLTSGSDICACDTLTAEVLSDLPYTTPDDPDSQAPWYDPDVPASAEFAGFLLLSVDGVDDYPVARQVTNAVRGGGSLGPARVRPRTMTFSGLLLGATCCAVEYGLTWLAQVLQGCAGMQCGGDCVSMYDCCPGEELTPAQFNAQHRRTYRRVALTDGPKVTGRLGTGECGGGACSLGADIVSVEFTLVAATPWAYGDEVLLLEAPVPRDDSDDCIVWCLHQGSPGGPAECADGSCRLKACTDGTDGCSDPACSPPAPPVPTSPDTCFCEALAVNQECYDLDLSGRPQWIPDVPVISVFAGSTDLRRLRITIYERDESDEGLACDEVAERKRCDPHAEWTINYLAAGSTVTLDGQVGRPLLDCGGECSTASSVFGTGGAPPAWPLLDCGTYCICLSTDAILTPAADATVLISISGRQ
jgi:hypothetical protein